MEFNLIGSIYFIVLLFVFIFKDIKHMLYLFFISSVATSISMINITSINASLLIGQVTSVFMIVKLFIYILKNGLKLKLPKCLIFILFIIWARITLKFPNGLSYGVIAMSIDGKYQPLKFNMSNITQYIYLINSLIIYIAVYNILIIKKIENYKIHILFSVGTLIILCFGILQHFMPIQKFDNLFRTYVNCNVQTINGKARISSLTMEASTMILYLGPMLAYFTMILFDKNSNKIKTFIQILLIVIVSFLSKSSTFVIVMTLIGVFGIIKIIEFIIFNKSIKLQRIIFIIFLILFLGICIVIFKNQIQDIYNKLIMKLNQESISGIERIESFKYHINLIKNHFFITGIGYGTVRTKDLFSTWFSMTGIVGIVLICIFFIVKLIKIVQINKSIFWIIFTTLIILLTSVPEPYYGYIWFYFAYADYIIYCTKKI